MPEGKIRHLNHMIDEQALRFIKNQFPVEWVQRELTPDYGLDIDLELFDYQDDNCITLGEHVFLQIKGTKKPKYNKIHFWGNGIEQKEKEVINYSLEVSELNLVERMGSAIPVLLVMVDLKNKKAYHICLNDYIKKVLPYQNSDYKKQSTITVHIPTDNIISSDDLRAFRWYGKRAKIYSLFNEMISDINAWEYKSDEDLVICVRRFIDNYIEKDVWNIRSVWPCFDYLYLLMKEMKNNNFIQEEAKRFIQSQSGNDEGWEKKLLYLNGSDIATPAYICAQKVSIRNLYSKIMLTNEMFECNARNFFMPISSL